jgi:hypothetical protein
MAIEQRSVEEAQVTRAWAKMLGSDPVPLLLSSDEPAARWVTLTAVLDRAPTDPDVLEARGRVVADAHTRDLVERLPGWASGVRVSGPRRGAPGHACPTRSRAGVVLVASPTSARW